MRIVVDIQGAQTRSRFRGIGRYTIAFVRELARVARDHEVHVILNANFVDTIDEVAQLLSGCIPHDRIHVFCSLPNISYSDPNNSWRRSAAENIRTAFIDGLCPDALILTSAVEGYDEDYCSSVSNANYAVAVILYDLIPLADKDAYLGSRQILNWYMDRIGHARSADLIFTISDSAKREICELLEVNEIAVHNISAAADGQFRALPIGEANELLGSHNIDQPYVMYSGSIESRKNVDRLISAFADMPQSTRDHHLLVVVGRHHELEKRHLVEVARSRGIGDRVRLLDHVEDRQLVNLYNGCRLFVLPSLHEGFGLPALEAMACGVAVIGSNRTSIPEVIGLPEALFDPTDQVELSQLMVRALTDDAFRRVLLENSAQQAQRFSWKRTATAALKALRAVVGSHTIAPTQWSVASTALEGIYNALLASLAALDTEVPPSMDDLRGCASAIALNQKTLENFYRRQELPERIRWRVEGPFDSSYSLALLNRETAKALRGRGHEVALHSTEGPGDFDPKPSFLDANPEIAEMFRLSRASRPVDADVASRNLFPPRVRDMSARTNVLHHYAWEETAFPLEWVDEFNDYLQGITCLSKHVKKILIDNGVTVPLAVSGCGVDHWERIEPDTQSIGRGKAFTFLHVSSCFPRKGVEVLLQAYGDAFSSADDVSLVIKTFTNPHNEVHRWLKEAHVNRIGYPDVVVIEEDLTEQQLKALYLQSDVLVAPSFAEGFGLPLAEAMLCSLPVITTGWGGQTDFCNEETAWLVEYDFARALTHFGLYDSIWAVPRRRHLASVMREVYELPEFERKRRPSIGADALRNAFKWSDVAECLEKSTREFARIPDVSAPRIGWVSTWNIKCGIAVYSQGLLSSMRGEVVVLAEHASERTHNDSGNVVRCWRRQEPSDFSGISEAIERYRIDTIVIQFNYGFFPDLAALGQFIDDNIDAGKVVVMTMHSTVDPVQLNPRWQLKQIAASLRECSRILVHSVHDVNRLKAIGIVDNVALFPLGIRSGYDAPAQENLVFTVASYGFFLPNKGLLELIEAIGILVGEGRALKLRMVNAEYPDPVSAETIARARERIRFLGLGSVIDLETRFLDEEEGLALLRAADLIVYPYQQTGESASASVRNGIAAGRPVLVSPSPIFEDVTPAVTVLPGYAAADIAFGIRSMMDGVQSGDKEIEAKQAAAAHWRDAHQFPVLGKRLAGMLTALRMEAASQDRQ